jgi:serine/threonine-protein kinase HipA
MNVEVRYRGDGEDALVGLLSRSRGEVFFQYESAWRGSGMELSPYAMPLSEERAIAPRDNRFHGLIALFADSLPDWWGEKLMRRYVESVGRDGRDLSPLDKLCFQGDRAMGALAYEPDTRDGEGGAELELAALADAAAMALSGDTGDVMNGLLRSGHSAGGAQPKVVLGMSADRQTVVSGERTLPAGFDHWLVKFDLEPELEDGRAEAACGLAAHAAGVDMPELVVLEDGAGRAHFAVRRFDRRGAGGRVHVQTYTALAETPVSEPIDYSDMMDMTRELTNDHRQVEQLFRRAVFNVLLGNEDDHGKNHSFLMERGGEWTLAPAYDLMQGGHPLGGGMRACGVMGRMAEIRRDDLLRLAEAHGVRGAEEVIGEIEGVLGQLEEFGAQVGMSERRVDELKGGLRVIS